MILRKFVTGPLRNNVILLASEKTKEAVVIDPAEGTRRFLIPFVEKHQFHLSKILLTHSHWDHITEAALLKKEFQLPIWIHKKDAPNLENPGVDEIPFPQKIFACKADHYLKDREEILVGEIVLRVLHTPGHTPGSVCFYIPKEDILLSGDTLFHGCIGKVELPTSKPLEMWNSCKKLSQLPSSTRVIPGHGMETTIGKEKWLSHAEEYFG